MRIKKIFCWVCFAFFLLSFQEVKYAAERKDGIDQFPKEYQAYLIELQKKHPNWKFTALYTGLDWNYVMDQENQFGKNLVPKSYTDSWKNTNPGEYNVEVDAGWVDCSRKAIEYTMDPRNFLNEVRIFQFEELSYETKENENQGIEKILYGTEFFQRTVEYLDSVGNLITMQQKYSDLISKAGKQSAVSSYHLASRIKQEVGPFLSHHSISGTVDGFEGLYNFYNIGATSSAEPMGAIKNGLRYAKDGKGASQSTKDKFLIPWNNKEKAITGGGIFIGSSYIHLGQDTIYLQKFHVVSNNNEGLFWHQYMTNVLAPYSESKSIYQGYVNSGMLEDELSFVIPVYENMPEIPIQSPNIKEEDFIQEKTEVYANVNTTLNIRTGPATSYEILTTVEKGTKMTRIAKGRQAGELWDQVILANGMIGYVFQYYLKEVPQEQIQEIRIDLENNRIQKGESQKIKVEIFPEEARDQEIIYLSKDPKIATIDQSGNLIGIKSGKTIIEVKSVMNQVSAQVEIQVFTPVYDLQIPEESIMLEVEDTFLITPIILPEDADNQNISFYSENEDIVQVDSNGTVTARKEGTGKIIIQAEDNKIKKELKVIVVSKIEEDEVFFDEDLKIDQNIISGWDAEKMTVKEMLEKITSKYAIEIYDKNGEKLGENQKAGTGCTIKIIGEEGIRMEYKIILYGDVDGNGKINSLDLLILQRHILEIQKLQGVFLKAGNINKNGKNPNSLDLLKIQRHILGIQKIEQ